MNRLHLSVLLLALLIQLVPAQQPEQMQGAMERLASSILVGGHSMDYATELSDGFGGRLTGSPTYQRATEWAAAKFRSFGIKDVRLEPFRMPNGWERGYARAQMIAPVRRHLYLESLGWSPSTPPGGVRGNVVLVKDLHGEKIKAQANELKGHIAFVDLATALAGGFDSISLFLTAPQFLKEAGATAIVLTDFETNNVLNAEAMTFGGQANPLPAAQIGQEDAKLINRLLEKSPVTIEFQFENQLTGPIQVNNVIAEIRGRERPDEWIIIGAHLDSWDYGTGAQDNGTGCAMVLETARALAALGGPPRRSVRFALWGGEEQGILGSTAYVRAHAAELKNCVAVLNTDNGAGHPRGWKVEGRNDVSAALRPFSKAYLTGLSGDGISSATSFDTDHGPFMLEGIPALDLWVDMKPYGLIHHKASDTVDKIDAHNLAAGSAILAMTAYHIAERSEPIAPHLEHAAVGEILEKAELKGFLKALGLWQ